MRWHLYRIIKRPQIDRLIQRYLERHRNRWIVVKYPLIALLYDVVPRKKFPLLGGMRSKAGTVPNDKIRSLPVAKHRWSYPDISANALDSLGG